MSELALHKAHTRLHRELIAWQAGDYQAAWGAALDRKAPAGSEPVSSSNEDQI